MEFALHLPTVKPGLWQPPKLYPAVCRMATHLTPRNPKEIRLLALGMAMIHFVLGGGGDFKYGRHQGSSMLWLLVVVVVGYLVVSCFWRQQPVQKVCYYKGLSFKKIMLIRQECISNSQLSSFGIDMDHPQTSGAVSKYNHSEIDAFHFNLKKHRI